MTIPASVLRRSYAFERLGAPAAVLDAHGVVVETNEAWRLFASLNEGLPATTGPGVNYLDICDAAFVLGVQSAGTVAAGLRAVLDGDRRSFEHEYACPSPLQDRWFLLHASSAPVHDGAGIVMFHVNITTRKILEGRLAQTADLDPATGLPDRLATIRFIDDLLQHATLHDGMPTAISIAVDGLDAVDDELGHPAGEELFVQVTARARRTLRSDDYLCRIGTRELVVVSPNIRSHAATLVIRRLRAAIGAPFQIGTSEVSLGVTVGVATARIGSSGEELIAASAAAATREVDVNGPAPGIVRMTRPPPPVRAAVIAPERTMALPAADAQRDAVVAHSSDLVIYFESDGTIMWASPATQALFGITVASLVGRNGLEFIHPDDRDRALTDMLSISGFGETVRCEFRVVADDGAIHWVEETATNLVDDPHVGYIVANLNNITARKHDEDAIRLQHRLLDAAGQAIIAIDMTGTVFYWNAAATDLYGWTDEEARRLPVENLLAPAAGWEDKATEVAEHVLAGKPWSGDFLTTRKGGGEVPIFLTDTPVLDDDGVQIGIIAVASDITERKRHEQAAAQLAAIVTSSTDAMFSTDLDGKVLAWNYAAEQLYDYTAVDMIGANISITFPDDRALIWDEMIGIVRAGGSTTLDTVRRRADGIDIDLSISVSAMRDGDGRPIGASASVRDITERKKLERDLVHMATHDALTDLANRTLLLKTLGAAIAAREADDAGVGVLFFDVDRFKIINDSMGHDLGDDLLVAIAETLRDVIDPGDLAARFGDDSFAIVLPGLDAREKVYELAARIRVRLGQGVTVAGERYFPTVSSGMVVTKAGDSETAALHDAETAMYRAKEKGRNRAEWFDPSLRRDFMSGFEVERDLRRAIACDELFLEFQPVIDLDTDHVSSCEALIRWHHPSRGRLSPDDFIPVAEQTGLIVSVGRWVLRHALAAARQWPASVMIAVNLSPCELAEPDLLAFVKSTLADLDVAASRLVFEITETTVVEDPTAAARAISALRALGVRVIIDDFGTGYTSLSFLRDYQIDGLKIDRSYITDLAYGSTAIVDAMIRMSAALGMHVIAEGIETEAQLEQLRALGCRYIQGFLVGQPVASADLPFM